MTRRKKLLLYEREKRKLSSLGLSPQEYQKKLRELVRRLGI